MNFDLAITYIASLPTESLRPPISISAQHITIALQKLGFDAINVRQMMTTCPSHAGVQCKQPSWCVCVMVVSTIKSIQKRMTVPDYWSAETAWQTTQAQRLSYAKELQWRRQHSIIPPSTSRLSLVSKMANSMTMHVTARCSRHKTRYHYTCHNMQKVANLTRSVYNNGRAEGDTLLYWS